MGKGDKKTKRGKLFQGSFGVRRPKKAAKAKKQGVQEAKKPAPKKEVKPKKTAKAEEPARKKEEPAKKKEETAKKKE